MSEGEMQNVRGESWTDLKIYAYKGYKALTSTKAWFGRFAFLIGATKLGDGGCENNPCGVRAR